MNKSKTCDLKISIINLVKQQPGMPTLDLCRKFGIRTDVILMSLSHAGLLHYVIGLDGQDQWFDGPTLPNLSFEQWDSQWREDGNKGLWKNNLRGQGKHGFMVLKKNSYNAWYSDGKNKYQFKNKKVDVLLDMLFKELQIHRMT